MMWPQGDDAGSDLDKIRKKHAKKEDLIHPEMRPSTSRYFVQEHRLNEVAMGLEVKGLGVIWMSAGVDYDDPRGALNFRGVGIFTTEEIRG